MSDLFTWSAITTMAGASALAYIIVAYTKRAVDYFWPRALGTDMYTVLISFLILLSATAVNQPPLTWDKVLLSLFNAFMVAATASKMHEKALCEAKRKKEKDEKK